MAGIERPTITLPTDMAAAVKRVIGDGDYASTREVVREALRDWKHKRALQLQELTAALKVDIAHGMADIAAGRVTEFDMDHIIARGKQRSARRASSG